MNTTKELSLRHCYLAGTMYNKLKAGRSVIVADLVWTAQLHDKRAEKGYSQRTSVDNQMQNLRFLPIFSHSGSSARGGRLTRRIPPYKAGFVQRQTQITFPNLPPSVTSACPRNLDTIFISVQLRVSATRHRYQLCTLEGSQSWSVKASGT